MIRTLGCILFMMSIGRPVEAQSPQISHGKHLFEQVLCVTCHGKDGTTPFNLTLRLDSLSDTHLISFIKNPAEFGNRRMPAFESVLSDTDMEALIVYLRFLSQRTRKNRKTQ